MNPTFSLLFLCALYFSVLTFSLPLQDQVWYLTPIGEYQNMKRSNISQNAINSQNTKVKQTESQKAEILLEDIFSLLKSLIENTHFETEKFESISNGIENHISQVSAWVAKHPFAKSVVFQLQFVRNVFRTMKLFVETSKFYDNGNLDVLFLRPILLINVRLLTLFDSYGYPNYQENGFKSQVGLFKHILEFWEETYRNINTVPRKVKLLFENQVSEAHNTLHILQAYIPK